VIDEHVFKSRWDGRSEPGDDAGPVDSLERQCRINRPPAQRRGRKLRLPVAFAGVSIAASQPDQVFLLGTRLGQDLIGASWVDGATRLGQTLGEFVKWIFPVFDGTFGWGNVGHLVQKQDHSQAVAKQNSFFLL
jgi:hypothetical protein